MDNSWVAIGKDCICVRERWIKPAGIIGLIMNIGEIVDGPKFMQQYRIKDIETVDFEDIGHKVKLVFDEYPGERWCACGFRPLEKVEDEEHKKTTAPVDLEKV